MGTALSTQRPRGSLNKRNPKDFFRNSTLHTPHSTLHTPLSTLRKFQEVAVEKEPYWLGHRERLRLRAEAQGWDDLKPYEMIELVLYYAVPRVDVTEPARNLITAFKTVDGVFRAPKKALLEVPGVTAPMADWLLVTGELMRAYGAFRGLNQPRIFRYRDVLSFLVPRWRAVRPPECWMIYTDFGDNLLTYTVLCDSLSWYEPEYVRQSVREAVALQARHAVLVCFVGTGPLDMEQEETEHLLAFSRTLRGIEVELLDCVLVGESGFYSMNVEGKLQCLRQESQELELHENYVRGEKGEN